MNEIKLHHKHSVEKLSTHNNSDLDYNKKNQTSDKIDQKSVTVLTNQNSSIDISTTKFAPKSFIDTSNPTGIFEEQPVFAPKQFSSSFTTNFKRYRNNSQIDYLTNIKYCVKTKPIAEKESRAEESHYQKETHENMNTNPSGKIAITNTGTLNNTLVLNSIENDHLDRKDKSSQKILVKHSLKKNKSPRFLKPLKKKSHLRPGNNTEILEEPNDNTISVIYNNKETLSKYRYLFADIGEDIVPTIRNFRKAHTKTLSELEDSDFTSLQKFGTIYSTNKTLTSQVEDVKMSFNSVSRNCPFGNPNSNRPYNGN